MALFSRVPVVEVHNDNFRELWPTLLLAIKTSSFVAIDAELSGLGNRKLLNAKSVDTRYAEMCEVAKSRSIISLGLSCFKLQKYPADVSGKALDFRVQTFNITLLCSENYVVEPLSLKFLVEHGFDFNKQCSKGIPYYRGPDRESDKKYQTIRQLFNELIISDVPVILHNALVDLVFLYQNFYTDVPATIQKFTADLSEIFTGGIFDTKYISEFKSRMSASYLEYIFRKSQRDNRDNAASEKKHITLSFLSYPDNMPDVVMLPCGLDDQPHQSQEGKSTACFHFSSHGWCPAGNGCSQSHDIDCILDTESLKKRKKNKKKNKTTADDSTNEDIQTDTDTEAMETSFDNSADLKSDIMKTTVSSSDSNHTSADQSDNALSKKPSNGSIEANTEEAGHTVEHSDGTFETAPAATQISRRTGGHRAGYDSFMTGFAFACSVANFGTFPTEPVDGEIALADFGLQELVNKVALGGKDFPLLIQKGNFAKTSNLHNNKIQKLKPTEAM